MPSALIYFEMNHPSVDTASLRKRSHMVLPAGAGCALEVGELVTAKAGITAVH